MNQSKSRWVWLAFVVAAGVTLPAEAFARGGSKYSCKGDSRLDVPMEFAIRIESAARVHVSAYGGSDKSRTVTPAISGAWRVYDAAGMPIDHFSKAMLVAESPYMLRETNLEGLVPGETYTIALTSQDLCANRGTVQRSVTMPSGLSENDPPVISTPELVSLGGWGFSSRVLVFSASDDSGIRQIQIHINGAKVSEVNYSNGASVRWWCDEYADDGVESTLEGPFYYFSYPSGYRGTNALVEIVAVDLYGAQTIVSAQLGL